MRNEENFPHLTPTSRRTSHIPPAQLNMDNIINTIVNFNIWAIGKLFVLVGLGVYAVFAFIVVRQVKLMTEVVSGILTNFLRVIAWLFFLFSVSVFVLVLLFL